MFAAEIQMTRNQKKRAKSPPMLLSSRHGRCAAFILERRVVSDALLQMDDDGSDKSEDDDAEQGGDAATTSADAPQKLEPPVKKKKLPNPLEALEVAAPTFLTANDNEDEIVEIKQRLDDPRRPSPRKLARHLTPSRCARAAGGVTDEQQGEAPKPDSMPLPPHPKVTRTGEERQSRAEKRRREERKRRRGEERRGEERRGMEGGR
eukprot:764820-Hanusia_phi.AAC.8